MGEALYRKYRPKSLDDVVGQPHITKTLSTALKEGKISHGYLFSGPRGVGKTSIARILAHQVNDFEYGDTRGALDIIEIDAASNRRIDEIRDLRDKVHLAPVAGKYKVYIIDEVHMLTREAFNALLKTLEEPPAHVIFILATTEAHKLPETIVSRTQRHSFKPVAEAEVVEHLSTLAKKEKVSIDQASLQMIAQHGEGSFRDSISLLDQLSILGTISANDVQQALGIPSDDVVKQLLEHVASGDLNKLHTTLEEARQSGVAATKLSSRLIHVLKEALLDDPSGHKNSIRFIESLLQVLSSVNPYDQLELTLYDECLVNVSSSEKTTSSPSSQPVSTPQKEAPAAKPEPIKPAPKTEPKPGPQPETIIKPVKKSDQTSTSADFDPEETWKQVLDIVKKSYNTLYGVARMATPQIDDGVLVLSVPFAFHQKRLSAEKNSKILSDTLLTVVGNHVTIRTEIKAKEKTPPKNNSNEPKSSDTLQTVTEIFGGGEVLET